tara:strand:+ start:3566 stop:4657 length:1092 start_codon:yes stop_codon:yes gene_type:complete
MATSSRDLVERYATRITELRKQGLGRLRIAKILSKEIGVEVNPYAVQSALEKLGLRKPYPAAPRVHILEDDVPADAEDEPIEKWIERRVEVSRKKVAKFSRSARHLTLPPEPLGIAILGDPHVDNDGCDWGQLFDHVTAIRSTPGVLAACVGDMQDNWVGRLARIYANSSTTATDGWRASRWLLESLQWIAVVGGNHDAWAHGPGIDPLRWLTRECGVQCYDTDELRIHLNWSGRPDLEPLIWILRHDFSGRSWFHPTHGPHKEAMLDGRCHLLTAGHIHQWGVLTTEQRHGRITNAVRVRGYKRADAYAKAKGFYEQKYGAACLVVIDPEAPAPVRIQLFWDIDAGCDYLKWLRNQRQENPK